MEQIPTYIHIDSFRFEPNSVVNPQPITLSHHITQVWAYYNNSIIGEFDLPCTFPVITNGSTTGKLQLFPGVLTDGQNSTIDLYPFYQADTSFVVNQKAGTVNTYEPATKFYSSVKPYYLANFNQGVPLKFSLVAGNRPIFLETSDSLVFENGGSGMIYMFAAGDSSVDSSNSFTIPSGSAYIEFNYRCDVPFSVGLQSNLSSYISSTPYYLAGVAPSNTWQKFYLNVKAFVLSYPGTNYNLFINTVLPPGQATGKVLLDNIQLVTF